MQNPGVGLSNGVLKSGLVAKMALETRSGVPGSQCRPEPRTSVRVRVRVRVRAARGKVWGCGDLHTHPRSLPRAAGGLPRHIGHLKGPHGQGLGGPGPQTWPGRLRLAHYARILHVSGMFGVSRAILDAIRGLCVEIWRF